MLEHDENLSVLNLAERERPSIEAQRAYADLLNALCGAIHLNEGQEGLSQAIESLMAIAECWSIAQETDPSDLKNIPFAKQSEIDLVETLLGLATYTYPFEGSYAELRFAFLEAVGKTQINEEQPQFSK